MKPFFRILQGGNDVTAKVSAGNRSLSVTDGVGMNSDTITYEISDEGGIVNVPETGVDLTVIGGYLERAPRNFGRFVVDEVTLDGYPQTISVNGQSIGAKTAAKEPRSQSFKAPDFKTYGDIIEAIASRNGLSPQIAANIRSKASQFEAQAEENDLEFLTRIGARSGFDVTIKDKNLIITPRGYGKSAGGILLPIIEIRPGFNIISYSVSRKDKPKYGKVKATYFDRDEVKKKEVDVASSEDGPDFLIRTPFKSEEEAVDAARTRAEDLRRGSGTAEFTIAGYEQARAEAFVEVEGVRSSVDGRWRATSVTHDWSASGSYTTKVSCELPGEDG